MKPDFLAIRLDRKPNLVSVLSPLLYGASGGLTLRGILR